MEITPNDTSASKAPLSSLAPKILQLINSLAEKPLLIEKLLLNQAQGVLLKLVTPSNPLKLQLPIETAVLFKSIGQNRLLLTLSTNSQQQVQLQLTQSGSDNSGNQPPRVIVFQTSKLLPGQILQLDNPKSFALIQQKSASGNLDSQVIEQSRLVSSRPALIENSQHNVKLPHGGLSNTETLTSATSASKNNSIQTPVSQAHRSAPALDPSHSQSSLTLSESVTAKRINEDKITIADAARQLLKSHFSKQLPVSRHLANINKIANIIANLDSTSPLEVKLQKQIKQLQVIIQKPFKLSAGEIKQLIANSGHLLERNLSKQIAQEEISTKQPVKHKNRKNPPDGSIKSEFSIKQMKLENSSIDKQTSLPKANRNTTALTPQSNDMKLHLMKIRSTLEAIIKPAKQPSGAQSRSPSSAPVSNTNLSDPKPMPAEQRLAKATGEPVIQVKTQFINQQQMIVKQATELLAEVKNVVSKIESNQLLSLKNDLPNLHQFLVDLPLKNHSDIDSFEMLFEHSDVDNAGQRVKQWKVVVRFDLEPLGPMFAQVELENERISTHFFAQSQQTAQLINQHIHVLKKSLFAAGVNIDKLAGSQGKIPERLLVDNEQLIDTHA